MRKLDGLMISCAILAASPAFGQVDPGYRTWVEQPVIVETIDGELIRFEAYRLNGDGTITYRTSEGKEVTFDKSEVDQLGKG
jgi:hypothetical protein